MPADSTSIEYEDKRTIIMGKYFGTDGFRGEANVVLTVEHAFKVGRYLGLVFRPGPQGEDRDRQGYEKEQLHV